MQWIMQERVDLARPQGLHRWPEQLMVPGDAQAHRWVVTVCQDGTPVDLTGWDIKAYLTRADNVCVPVDGTADGNVAGVSFDSVCYAIQGELFGTLQASKGEVRITLARGIWHVGRQHGDQVIDAGEIVPSLPELLAQISAMQTATEEARTATAEAGVVLAAMEDAINESAPAIIREASGGVVSIDDAAARHVRAVTTTLTAVQAGTGAPSPTNIRPITGWNATGVHRTQKNLLPPLTKGTSLRPSTGEETENTGGAVSGWIPWTAETAMVISGLPLTLFNFVAAYDANRGYLGRTTASSASERTLTEDGWQGADVSAARYIRVTVYENSTAVSGSIDDIDTAQMQLELGSTATEYEEYQGEELSAELPETIYGGLLNWTTGVLTVTHVHYSLAVSEMNNAEAYPGWKGLDGLKGYMGTVSAAMGICSAYGSPSVDTLSGAAANAIIYLHDSGMTQSEWIAAYPDLVMDVVIPINNTYDVQLTPQQLTLLKGANTLRSDAGDTSVTYIADTKLYIDNAVAAIAAGMLNA